MVRLLTLGRPMSDAPGSPPLQQPGSKVGVPASECVLFMAPTVQLTFLYPPGSSGWLNQIDRRQICKTKYPNLIHTYAWKHHTQEKVRDPTYRRGRKIERELGREDILS